MAIFFSTFFEHNHMLCSACQYTCIDYSGAAKESTLVLPHPLDIHCHSQTCCHYNRLDISVCLSPHTQCNQIIFPSIVWGGCSGKCLNVIWNYNLSRTAAAAALTQNVFKIFMWWLLHSVKFIKMKTHLQECPAGAVNEATFKEIYEKFFPQGSKCITVLLIPELIIKY